MSTSHPPASSVLEFLFICHKLKSTKRTGWVRRGIVLPESISDHMYMMSLMAWLAAPSSSELPGSTAIDKEKCIKIALVHDIAESIVGDITPSDPISKEEKSRMEEEAIHKLRDVLSGCSIADEFVSLWKEYESASTLEGQLVKQIDKFEMMLQAYIYERDQQPIDLSEFYTSAKDKLTNPILKQWFEELMSYRIKNLPHLKQIKDE